MQSNIYRLRKGRQIKGKGARTEYAKNDSKVYTRDSIAEIDNAFQSERT